MSTAREQRFELRALWRVRVGDYATALGYSADGTDLVVGDASGGVRVLDARSGQARWMAPAHEGGVLAVAWNPRAGLLASAGQDGRARIFAYDGGALAELPGTSAWVEAVAWSPDGSRLATASGKTVRLWTEGGAPVVE
ncbi:MAG: WD40 repeat domain-containing protein, partial [Polyangiaceae bacterium]